MSFAYCSCSDFIFGATIFIFAIDRADAAFSGKNAPLIRMVMTMIAQPQLPISACSHLSSANSGAAMIVKMP